MDGATKNDQVNHEQDSSLAKNDLGPMIASEIMLPADSDQLDQSAQ